jgi:hypothetical protein
MASGASIFNLHLAYHGQLNSAYKGEQASALGWAALLLCLVIELPR